MTARTRTHYGDVPDAYRRWWLENAYPIKAAQIGGDDDGGGGILERREDRSDPRLQRLRDFGACWSWWSVPDDERSEWRALG